MQGRDMQQLTPNTGTSQSIPLTRQKSHRCPRKHCELRGITWEQRQTHTAERSHRYKQHQLVTAGGRDDRGQQATFQPRTARSPGTPPGARACKDEASRVSNGSPVTGPRRRSVLLPSQGCRCQSNRATGPQYRAFNLHL